MRTISRNGAGGRQSGFSFIELIAVVLLITTIALLAAGRIDHVLASKERSELRRFIHVWKTLIEQSILRGESYRLAINLGRNSYYVRREVSLADNEAVLVDYLANLRTKKEQERRAESESDLLPSLEEEFVRDEATDQLPLDQVFYRMVFFDPQQAVRLGRPLEFPQLAEESVFDPAIELLSVIIGGHERDSGTVPLRIRAGGNIDEIIIHLRFRGEDYSIVSTAATRSIKLKSGHVSTRKNLAR